MSTLEEIREDGKRQDAEERFEYESPEPCGCQMLSACCGMSPGYGGRAGVGGPFVADTLTGFCPKCHDHVGFEKSDENTWIFKGATTYGDDADGNRGVPLRAYECRVCGNEVEVMG
jgi:hypothetical protein